MRDLHAVVPSSERPVGRGPPVIPDLLLHLLLAHHVLDVHARRFDDSVVVGRVAVMLLRKMLGVGGEAVVTRVVICGETNGT